MAAEHFGVHFVAQHENTKLKPPQNMELKT